MHVRHNLIGVSVLGLLAAPPAFAQTPAPADSADSGASFDKTDAGEVVVTAQRRTETLREVPIAITVVNGASIRETGANQLADITQRTPSLNFTATPGVPNFSVRGVGTNSFDYGIESAVGIAIDDVNVTLPRFVPLNSLADVDRVEVLRGPQGLLFGKNTTAGLISVTTRRPQLGVFGSSGRVQVGSRDQVQSQGVVNLPLGDTAAVRVAGGYQVQNPVIRAVGPGRLQDARRWFVNGKLLWQPTDRLTIYAIADYQKNSGQETYSTLRNFGVGDRTVPSALRPFAPDNFVRAQLTALGVVPSSTNRVTGIGSGDIRNDQKSFGAQATVEYDAGAFTLTSVTAYRDLKAFANNDVDQTPIPFLDINRAVSDAYQVTEELRIANSNPGRIGYVAGIYFYHQQIDAQTLQAGTLGILPAASPLRLSAVTGQANFDYATRSWAPFAQVTLALTDQLRLIGGARYTHDKIDSVTTSSIVPNVCNFLTLLTSGGRVCNGTLPAPRVGDRSTGDFSARGGVEYAIAEQANFYATYTRGYKGPAVSSTGGVAFAVDPETVDAFEVGAKFSLLDRRVSLNLAGFVNNFDDFQAQVFDQTLNGGIGAFRTGNAETLKTRGIEAEAVVRPIAGLSITGGVTYLDTEYGNYRVSCYFGQTAAQGCTPPGPAFNIAGFPLVGASKWTTSAGVAYDAPIGEAAKVFFNGDWRYRSRFYYGAGDPNTIQSGFSIVNAALGVGDRDDRLRVSVFVRNLFDKRYAATIFPGNFDAGQYAQALPDNAFRRWGGALEWRF